MTLPTWLHGLILTTATLAALLGIALAVLRMSQ